ncbi:metallopeptidase TldD-related protein [Actinoplanes sp. NBRC 103695]|uniref:TldD/PmbA family protein n=1 Tax=Actinoplanes sp. NBRC 103695 TaxID=3032202 RepID=UPI0024A329EF|nr:metallopeptidase TldD-related protein [Actinoplanes sp. NBRC 103695]GLY95728.1 peptidase [Actinoplanes sp. NBRC 103695]
MTELNTASRVLDLVRAKAGAGAEAEAMVHHSAEALTRFANSAIHQNVADATTTVRLRLHVDGRTATGSTTVTDAAGLESLVDRTVAAARLTPVDEAWAGLTPPMPLAAADDDFDQATAGASPDERAARVRAFVDAAGGLETAGYCRTFYRSGAFANSAGQAVSGRSAGADMDGIARDAGVDGVARLAGERLAALDGAELGARAAAKARAAGAAIELPPGRYEVVLEPDAVSDVLNVLSAYGFNGKAHARGESFARLGEAQFDPAVTIVDDPVGLLPFDLEGTPLRPLTMVDAGITAAVTHDRRSAAEAGAVTTGHSSAIAFVWGPVAHQPALLPGPGVASAPESAGPTAPTARPLVAGMRRGLLITDFWYTRVLDQKSLVMTGLTRNGVWLVEDGEVVAAVSNMRFTQNYPQALGPGDVLGVGAEAVPIPDRWAGHRISAPALHLRSWNLTGNASG